MVCAVDFYLNIEHDNYTQIAPVIHECMNSFCMHIVSNSNYIQVWKYKIHSTKIDILLDANLFRNFNNIAPQMFSPRQCLRSMKRDLKAT